ncbi:TrbG/VirB9 family P-type conjugative transfer protein [Tropicimonas isoalkanivorans]|uniref:Type IV secretion system protein VirB9 n=1 Tax=Tropicimonas isoalkanivorans TaxID=441112 RepID=A0A1I1PXL0_9RHOB|nr:TrbG/VirB9 family P-type conjugative transfer protein [Tropicimonas isoalkanivorans]SFD14624.1 type IV secretion system protein VirB9 [Tropicimonas isoalkanivorans]
MRQAVRTILGLAALLCALPAAAETIPAATRLDPRVRMTHYVDGQVYTLRVSLTRATTVEFGPGERIVSLVAGDTESFLFETIPGGRVFAIKPTSRGVETNVTVYTNQRSYYFRLTEGNSPFFVLRFDYPKTQSASSRSVRKGPIRSNYGASRRTAITPVSVWDDGTFTYFRFAESAPQPAIFKVVNGRERSVNSTAEGNGVMRVSGTSRQWTVRMGDLEVCIAELVHE